MVTPRDVWDAVCSGAEHHLPGRWIYPVLMDVRNAELIHSAPLKSNTTEHIKTSKAPNSHWNTDPIPIPPHSGTMVRFQGAKKQSISLEHTTMEQLLGRLKCFVLTPSEATPFPKTPRKLKGMDWCLSGFHTGAASSSLPLHRHRN